MGRVDEAMRRAAEAATRGAAADVAVAPVEQVAAADPIEFPAERAAESARPRRLGVSDVVPGDGAAKPATPAILPSLRERIDARLHRKVVVDQDMDAASREQYRRLATALLAAQAASGLKVVLMASAVASEGKSLTSSNLSLTFSEAYQRNVLLIDGDLRRPSIHTIFGLQSKPGLCEGLLGQDERKLALHRVSPRLTVLTAGQSAADPMSLLASSRMRQLIDEARETFDWIIIDTPPVGLLSDASLLAHMADGALLVIKAGSTAHDLVSRAVAAIGKEQILGVVLNQVDETGTPAYKYQQYYSQQPPAATATR
jgi:protein-tyrosine kinase